MKPTSRSVKLTLPAEAEYLDIVRLTLYGVTSKLGFSYEEIEDMKVAVSEACNNVIVHTYEPDESGVLEVSFDPVRNGVFITIKDQGQSFDHIQKIESISSLHNKSLQEVRTGGLGLYLMQALMDKVEVKGRTEPKLFCTNRLAKARKWYETKPGKDRKGLGKHPDPGVSGLGK
nr:anti-sigma B factor RsbW [Paenibacillus larvae]